MITILFIIGSAIAFGVGFGCGYNAGLKRAVTMIDERLLKQISPPCPECGFVRYRPDAEYHSDDCSQREASKRAVTMREIER